MKRKELLQRDDDDGDSMLSSATSDTSSTKRKRFALCHILLAQLSLCFFVCGGRVTVAFCFQSQEEYKEKPNENPLSCCD